MKKYKMNYKKILVFSLITVLSVTTFTGCNKEKGSKKNEVLESKYASEYPIDAKDKTLTYWMPMTANISNSATNYGDLPVAKELEKRTGIKVEYIHPSLTNHLEKFNLMIAGGDLPDIIQYYWSTYPGGPQAAIDEGVILPLNSIMNSYATNFKQLMEKHPDVAREAKTDEGNFFAFGVVAADRKLNTSAGPIIRLDWLEELGLEKPETIDEWYTVLKAFKEKKNASAPLSMGMNGIYNDTFIGAYGISYDFYQIDGKVKYGPAQKEYKEFLTTMKKWYDEGLYDQNFSTNDAAAINANMLNGNAGATWNALGGGIGVLTNAATDPKAVYGGAPYPTHKKGEPPKFGQAGSPFNPLTAITTKCKDVELAAKFLDYGYTDAGKTLFNFGIEGTSYEMVDGKPKYTELITKNPNGLSMSQALTLYSHGGQNGSFEQDLGYLEQYAGLPQQQEAWNLWLDTDVFNYRVPSVNVAEEDATEYATILTDITTYRDEMYIKFVTGTESLDNFDKYLANLEKIGLKRLTEIKQKAYEAYMAR